MGFAFKVLLDFFLSYFLIMFKLKKKKSVIWNWWPLCLKNPHCTEGSILMALAEDGVYVHTVQ